MENYECILEETDNDSYQRQLFFCWKVLLVTSNTSEFNDKFYLLINLSV